MALTHTAPTEKETGQLESLLANCAETREFLIPILQTIQTQYRYLPEFALRRVANKLHVSLSEVYQVATFYNCFSLEPVGAHLVQVCLGTACHVRGAPLVLDRILRDLKLPRPGTTADREFTVRTVRCVGCCGLAPVVRGDEETFAQMTQNKVRGLVRKLRPRKTEPQP